MDKAEWDLMGAREKDALVAEKIRGFQWRVLDITPFKSMKADLGKRFLCHPDTVRQYPKATGEEALSQEWDRFFAHYTTSRDAVVSVEEEISRRELEKPYSILLILGLEGYTYLLDQQSEKTKDVFEMDGLEKTVKMLDIRRADPDLCCYCALRVVENAH